MAEVKKVRKVKNVRMPVGTNASGANEELEELLPDEPDEELEELEEPTKEITPEGGSPLSEAEREELALKLLEESRKKKEMEDRFARLEKEAGEKKKRKVVSPRMKLLATLSVAIVTIIIASFLFYLSYEDYKTDTASVYDGTVYKSLMDGKTYWVPANHTVVGNEVDGAETGKDAAHAYKEYYRMDGKYSMKVPLGSISLELNWIYYLVFGIMVITGPNGMVRRNKIRLIKAKEEKFPDFIRDLAEFWKGGLSMDVAVSTLAKGEYGALDEDVEFMSMQLSWGVAFNEVLRMFLERVHTGLIERSIALIEEANRAGGKISDILLNVAHDAREIKTLDREREGIMKSYIFVMLISFLIYVLIIVVMAYVFIPAVAQSTEGLDMGSFGGVKIQSFDPSFVALLFFSSVIVQAIGGGVNAGIMGEGNLGASFWWITIFLFIGTAIFEFTGVSMGLG